MAAFDGLIAAGKAELEGKRKPRIRMGHEAVRTPTLEQLKDEARHNPRVKVSVRVGSELVPIPYMGPREEKPAAKRRPTAPVVVETPAPLQLAPLPREVEQHADRALRHAAHVYHTAGEHRHGEALDMLRAAAVTYAEETRQPAPVVALTIVARKSESVPALRPLTPDVPVFDPIEVARGIVEMAQAIRDSAHVALLAQIEKRVAEVERAHKAPRQVAPRVHRCDTCRKNVDTCYVFQGRVWCIECRKSVAKITARAERSAFAV